MLQPRKIIKFEAAQKRHPLNRSGGVIVAVVKTGMIVWIVSIAIKY
jgi:hypothetical protein